MRMTTAGLWCALALSAGAMPPAPSGAMRLAAHAAVLNPPNEISAQAAVAHHIETALAQAGYEVWRKECDGEQRIEAAVSGPFVPEAQRRTFIVGANHVPRAGKERDATGAVLELARLLKGMHPAAGTDVRFVFFVRGEATQPAHAGDFIAFSGSRVQAQQVRGTLAAFRAASTVPDDGLSSPAYAEGVTVSGRLMIAEGEFLRYPYMRSSRRKSEPDYDSMAQAVASLARLLTRLASANDA